MSDKTNAPPPAGEQAGDRLARTLAALLLLAVAGCGQPESPPPAREVVDSPAAGTAARPAGPPALTPAPPVAPATVGLAAPPALSFADESAGLPASGHEELEGLETREWRVDSTFNPATTELVRTAKSTRLVNAL